MEVTFYAYLFAEASTIPRFCSPPPLQVSRRWSHYKYIIMVEADRLGFCIFSLLPIRHENSGLLTVVAFVLLRFLAGGTLVGDAELVPGKLLLFFEFLLCNLKFLPLLTLEVVHLLLGLEVGLFIASDLPCAPFLILLCFSVWSFEKSLHVLFIYYGVTDPPDFICR